MRAFSYFLAAALLISALRVTPADAHAFLDRAIPGVGATVNNPPNELTLVFTQEIVPAFSNVHVSGPGGEAVPAGKASVDPGNPSVLHVRLSRALRPGTYTVSWHVVSVDTHPTSGSYHFTVAP